MYYVHRHEGPKDNSYTLIYKIKAISIKIIVFLTGCGNSMQK